MKKYKRYEEATTFYIYHATNKSKYKQILKDGKLKTTGGTISFYPYPSHYGDYQFKMNIYNWNKNKILDLLSFEYEDWYFDDWGDDLRNSKLSRKFSNIENEYDIMEVIKKLNKTELLYLIGEFGLELLYYKDIPIDMLKYEFINSGVNYE